METSENRGTFVHTASAQRQHTLPIEPPHLALPAIGAFVRPANVASVRVLEKCGFTLLGAAHAYWPDALWYYLLCLRYSCPSYRG
jgi:RimJ/RimL family protein N-acetyltransferase